MIKKYIVQGIVLSLTAFVMADEIDDFVIDADQIHTSLQDYVVISKKLLKLDSRALMFGESVRFDYQEAWKSPSPIGAVCCDLVFEFPKTTYVASEHMRYTEQSLKIYDSNYKELSYECVKARNDQSDDKVDRFIQSIVIYGDIPFGEIVIEGNYDLVFTFYGQPFEISLNALSEGPVQCDDGLVSFGMDEEMQYVAARSSMDMPRCELFKADGTPFDCESMLLFDGSDGNFKGAQRFLFSSEEGNLIFKVNLPKRQEIVAVPVSFIINADFSAKPEKKNEK